MLREEAAGYPIGGSLPLAKNVERRFVELGGGLPSGRSPGPFARQSGGRLVRPQEGVAGALRLLRAPGEEVLGLAEVEHEAGNNRMRTL